VADTISEIHQRSPGTYGRRRVRAALLVDYDMNVKVKLVNSIMSVKVCTGCRALGDESPT
jgi:putative transposase